MKSWLRSVGVDRAVANSIVLKAWQAIAGLVGLVLIAGNFSKEVQGFYYTFASLIALQSFVELGFNLVVLNFASHEWSRLHLGPNGQIEGDPDALSRLISLGRFAFKWYAGGALILLVVVGAGGEWFLGRATAPEVNWHLPWLAHIAFSSIIFWCLPFFALLEGCDQVAQVAKFRTYQAVAANIAIWIAILAGAGLWAAPAFSMTAALFCIGYLLVVRRSFFKPFFSHPKLKKIHWQVEVLPMQWRLALQGVMSYFVFSLFTPVMFYYHGPALAGQMGMTLQLVFAIQSIAAIWVVTKAPKFGILVARSEFPILDSRWRQAAWMSVLLMLCGVGAGFVSISYLTQIDWEPVHRILGPLPFLLLAGGALGSHAIQSIAIYLRAHKREVLTQVAVITGMLMAIAVWQLGMHYGASGAAAAYLMVMAGVAFPMSALIWWRSRLDWHR
jgi:hypothetical protein